MKQRSPSYSPLYVATDAAGQLQDHALLCPYSCNFFWFHIMCSLIQVSPLPGPTDSFFPFNFFLIQVNHISHSFPEKSWRSHQTFNLSLLHLLKFLCLSHFKYESKADICKSKGKLLSSVCLLTLPWQLLQKASNILKNCLQTRKTILPAHALIRWCFESLH